MNILLIDTSSQLCSVGIKYKEKRIFKTLDEGRTHSETLLPLINSTLENNNISLDSIDVLGVVLGPGSFTGIRIGISTIKAIALAKDIKVVEITSIEVLARSILEKSTFKIGIIDAKNDQIYAGIYSNEFELIKEYAGSIVEFIELLQTIEMPINNETETQPKYAFAGTGIKHREYIEKNLKANLKENLTDDNLNIIFSENINQDIKLALEGIESKMLNEANLKDGRIITPKYLKPSNAERKD